MDQNTCPVPNVASIVHTSIGVWFSKSGNTIAPRWADRYHQSTGESPVAADPSGRVLGGGRSSPRLHKVLRAGVWVQDTGLLLLVLLTAEEPLIVEVSQLSKLPARVDHH